MPCLLWWRRQIKLNKSKSSVFVYCQREKTTINRSIVIGTREEKKLPSHMTAFFGRVVLWLILESNVYNASFYSSFFSAIYYEYCFDPIEDRAMVFNGRSPICNINKSAPLTSNAGPVIGDVV